jgi:hypothetical protein
VLDYSPQIISAQGELLLLAEELGIPVHLVDGKSDWLISIMKDFDWLQVHVNNSFKNSSLNASRRQ